MAFTSEFKRRLQVSLAESELNKRALAKACKVSPSTVTRWMDESDSMVPHLKKLPAICSALNVSAAYLIHGHESMVPQAADVAKARALAAEITDLLK